MKYSKVPTLFKPQGSLQKGVKLSSQELYIYQKEKLQKDIEFFNATVPYISFFCMSLFGIAFALNIYNYNYEKRTGTKIWKKMFYSLLDIELSVEDTQSEKK